MSGKRKRSLLDQLYREFAAYYEAERCVWAPANPRRAFNLAVKTLYEPNREKVSLFQFIGLVYETLGFAAGGTGLFREFDPDKYHGRLPLEKHFLNLFRARLEGKLVNALRRGELLVAARQKRGKVGLPQRSFRQRQLDQEVAEALTCLSDLEARVIRLRYWDDASYREIGQELGMDHKTAGRRLDQALDKLRRQFGVAA